MEQITGYIADSSSWTIALVHPITGAAFEPGSAYGLVATFKNRENDADANAVIQKATGAGITVSGSNATVTLVRTDTADFCECNLHFGIRATNATTGESLTVAERRVKFEKPTTIETTTSVDVVTTETPLPFGGITSYVDEIESLSDYPSAFPPDLNSGYNIKTVNNYDITGEGNLDVLNAADLGFALPAAIEEDPAAVREAAGINLSQTGGATATAQYDADGNLVIGPADNNGALGTTGELKIPQFRRVAFMAPNGETAAAIYLWYGHSGGNEMIYESERHCFYWDEGFQFGSPATLRDGRFIYIQPNSASASDTLVESPPVALVSRYWDSTQNQSQFTWFQTEPTSAAAGSELLSINMGGTVGSDHRLTGGVVPVEVSRAGLWHAGSAPAFEALTDGATITITASKFKAVQPAKVTLAGNRTLAISGAEAGMRGVIYVKQDATGSRTLTLPTGSATPSGWALSTAAYSIDRLEWEYDGTYFFWSIVKGITTPLDSDASAFIARASITDDTQEAALNELVLKLKVAGVWSKLDAIYPFVGGNATAHSKNLKADAYNITWAGTPTHNGSGVTGDVASSAYGNTGWNPSVVGRNTSISGYVYNRTASPTDGGWFFGSSTASARFGLRRSVSVIYIEGPNNTSGGSTAYTSFAERMLHGRSDGATAFHANVATYNSFAFAGSTAPNQSVYLLARNDNGAASAYSNANLAFAAFGQSLTAGDYAALRAADMEFQTALAR